MATVYAQDQMLVVPFATVAAFKAHPTFTAVSNLRSGSTVLAEQDAELNNMLLMGSAQVENFCAQPIQAHLQTDNKRGWIARTGRLYLYPDHAPVRTVLSYSWGSSLGTLTTVNTPAFRIEDGRQIIVEPGATAGTAWNGSLQFGTPPSGIDLYTSVTYVAAYANAVLVGNPSQGATSITVSNPTGIFAGDTLRIWEPGKEESVVVASSWAGQNTYPFTSAAIPLVSGTLNAHTAGAGVTGFGADISLATIYYTLDGIQRWGTSSANWPNAKAKAATGKRTEDASAWEQKAMRLLLTYRRYR